MSSDAEVVWDNNVFSTSKQIESDAGVNWVNSWEDPAVLTALDRSNTSGSDVYRSGSELGELSQYVEEVSIDKTKFRETASVVEDYPDTDDSLPPAI